jgi:hypothetical protein
MKTVHTRKKQFQGVGAIPVIEIQDLIQGTPTASARMNVDLFKGEQSGYITLTVTWEPED